MLRFLKLHPFFLVLPKVSLLSNCNKSSTAWWTASRIPKSPFLQNSSTNSTVVTCYFGGWPHGHSSSVPIRRLVLRKLSGICHTKNFICFTYLHPREFSTDQWRPMLSPPDVVCDPPQVAVVFLMMKYSQSLRPHVKQTQMQSNVRIVIYRYLLLSISMQGDLVSRTSL